MENREISAKTKKGRTIKLKGQSVVGRSELKQAMMQELHTGRTRLL